MTNVLVTGKKPRFNPWLIVQYALRFWPLTVWLSGLLLCYVTNEVSVALSYEGLLWIPMTLGLAMMVVGACATIYCAGDRFFAWHDRGGWDDLKRTIDEKAENYRRPEDK